MIHYGDITKIHGDQVPAVHVITGGSPCQDLSVAGKREGLKKKCHNYITCGFETDANSELERCPWCGSYLDLTRSGLFMEQIRIIKEMRENDRRNYAGADNADRLIRPRFMVWENVPGAFSSNKGEDFRAVLEETAKVADKDAVIPGLEGGKWSPCGCILGNGWSIAWRLHDAQYYGVPQRRKRICLLADFNGDTAGRILFELQRKTVKSDSEQTVLDSGKEPEPEIQSVSEGVPGDTEACRKEGQGIAEDTERGVGASGIIGFNRERCGAVTMDNAMPTLQAAAGESGNNQPMVCFEPGAMSRCGGHVYEDVAGTVRANAGDNQQAVVYGIGSYDSNAMKSDNPHSGIYEADTSRTLDLNGGNPSCNQGGMAVVCLEGNGQRESHKGDGYKESDTMYTLNTVEQHAVCIENHPADSRVKISEDGVCQTLSGRMETGGGNVPMVMESINGEISGTLDASYYKGCGERQGVEREIVAQTYQYTTGTLSPGAHAGSYNGQDAYNDMLIVDAHAVDCRNATENEMNGSLQAKASNNLNSNNVCRVNSVVRRLTPMECERLQNFPDHWTDIGEWTDSKGKKHKDADSPRYKALGNSIALPFWQWMAERMMPYLGDKPTMASLFSGIGGFELVFSRAGCKPVWASEVEEFAIAVTKKRFPEE